MELTGNAAFTSANAFPAVPSLTWKSLYVCTFKTLAVALVALFSFSPMRDGTGEASDRVTRTARKAEVENCILEFGFQILGRCKGRNYAIRLYVFDF